MEEFEYEELIKATENFSKARLIGKGSHGCVYRASLANGKHVAVKKLSLNLEEDRSSKLTNELAILSSLVHNPHTVKLLGSARGPDHHLLLVMEFMPNGSLHDSLHLSPEPPSWSARFKASLQLARALESLHEPNPPIIHRDVKSTNVMFDSHWNAKLSDFSLAIVRDDSSNCQTSRPAGTIGYLDPCYTCPSKLSTKNDVFSFGVLTLEIMSGRKAIDVSKSPSSIVDWATSLIKKQRIMDICDPRIQPLPACSEGSFRHIMRVAMQCVSSDELHRPSAREVVSELEGVPVERVRALSWTNPLRSIILLRRRRKLTKKCLGSRVEERMELPCGRLLLREILADITLEENKV